MVPPTLNQSQAICIRRTRYSDTSLIVTWMTEHAGKIKTLARGALRPRSAFAGSIDLFHQVEIVWIPSRKSDLHTLKETTLLSAFHPAPPSHLTIQLASYFATLIDKTIHHDEPAPSAYDLLKRALQYLATHAPNQRALFHFERELCRLLGIWDESQTSHTANPSVILTHYGGPLPHDRDTLLSNLG